MSLLLLKLLLVPLLTAGVTLVSRRWGEAQGGKLASLPWVAGPISFFIATEQGQAFAAKAATGSTVAVLGLAAFCAVYIWMGKRYYFLPGLLLGYGVYCLIAWLATRLPADAIPVYAGTLLGLVLLIILSPQAAQPPVSARPRAWDIPLRMLVTALFVLSLTELADWLGPAWSGVLTPFPILTSVLAVFTHWQRGIISAAFLLYNLMVGLTGFATFLFVVAIGLPVWSLAFTYTLAAVSAVAVSYLTFWLEKRYRRSSPPALQTYK